VRVPVGQGQEVAAGLGGGIRIGRPQR
jgi:hypothetical protein